MNKEKNFISALVYVNNNADTIEKFLEKIVREIREKFLKFEIICVNDASKDDSLKVIKKYAEKQKDISISVINMSFYQGRELAMRSAIDLSIGDFVYEFDNVIMDYDAKIIIDVYNKSLEGYDIVSASPKGKQYFTSKLFYTIFNKFANNQYKIETESFRILSRRAINRINSINKSVPFRKAIYSNCGLKMFAIKYTPKQNEKQKIGKQLKKDRRNTAINALILFTDISYKISMIFSLIMMFITMLVAAYVIYIFTNSNPIAGWTTTMLFLSFAFFGLFLVLAIVIKYLSIIVNLGFNNKKYLVESIEKLN